MISFLQTSEDFQKYSEIVRICFQSQYGIKVFGLIEDLACKKNINAYMLGYFNGKQLTSAITNFHFKTNAFFKNQKASGIGYVVSDPAFRSQGHIRKLFFDILKKDYKDEVLYSFLYPFSIPFYNKMGYGILSNLYNISVDPEDIVKDQNSNCFVKKSKYSDSDIKDYVRIVNKCSTNNNFGLFIEDEDIEFFKEKLQYNDLFLGPKFAFTCQFSSFSKGGKLDIFSLFYEDEEGFFQFVNYISNFKSQIKNINLSLTYKAYRCFLFKVKNFRLQNNNYIANMGRIVNLAKVLQSKWDKDKHLIDNPFKIYVKDDFIPQNNAGYFLSNNEIKKIDFDLDKAVDISLISSIIMGSVSISELSFLPNINKDKILGLESRFFYYNQNINLNLFF